MATRFYYQANNAPTVSPSLDAGWGSTANVVRRLMSTAQNAATETVGGSVADGSTSCAVQLVSPPLAAQTITGTFTFMSRVRELDLADNVNKRVRSVRVYASDATTLRGTFSAYAQTSSTTEFATTFAGQIHAQNNGVGTLDVLDGDIIVAEFGYGVSATGDGSSQWETVLGGSGTDHAVSNGDTTGTVAWLEFSQTLTLAAATVTLTPATATLAAQSITATPGPVTVSATSAAATLAAWEVTPAPGPVTVGLTPAAGTGAAVAVTPTPLAVTMDLTSAGISGSAVSVTPSPGLVTTSIQPGLASLSVLAVDPQPGTVTVNLTAAAATLGAEAATPVPGVVTVGLASAAATLGAEAATGVQPGEVVMTLNPAIVITTAMDFGLTPGLVNVDLAAAAISAVPVQLTPAGVGPTGITLTPAVTTASGVQVTVHPGLVLTSLTVAIAATSGVPLGLTPGPVTVSLAPAVASLSGVTISAVPGPVTTALMSAFADWSGATLDLQPGPVTTATGFGTATWEALPVTPEPVEGILLAPATATLAGRKVTPKGQVLPLNTYELPLARVLLDSLTGVLVARTLNPPAHFALRTGQEVGFDLSQNEDLCCEGLAYVKINRVYPSTEFPKEDEDWSPCGPLAWAAELEMGIIRCAPVGDVDSMPTDSEWETATDLVANDSAAMRLAVEEFASRVAPLTDWMAGSWSPIGPVGACVGGVQTVTVGWIPC